MRLVVAFLLLSLSFAGAVEAQLSVDQLPIGSIVRMTSPALGPLSQQGTVAGTTATEIDVLIRGFGGSEVRHSIPLREFTRLESRIGTDRARGTLIGVAIGGALFAGVGLLRCGGECFEDGVEENSVEFFATSVLGAIAGGIIGNRLLVRHRWAEVSLGIDWSVSGLPR